MSKKLFRKFMCVLLVAILALNPLDTKAIASDYAPTYTVTTEAAPAPGGLGVSLKGVFGSIAVGLGAGGATVAADTMRDAQQQEARRDPETGREYKKSKSGSHKEKADNAPSWAFGERPYSYHAIPYKYPQVNQIGCSTCCFSNFWCEILRG